MINKARTMLLVFLIFISSTILVSAGTETQITQNERLTSGLSFYGNYIYWIESAGNGVHAYDLTAGKRTDIDGHFAYNQITSYGDKVVWAGDGGEAVYMYDISTGSEIKITPYGSFPDIYGNYVVYTNYYDRYHENDSIYLYDINTGRETKIASVYSSPAIYDKTVVWSQANGSSGYDICKYDITANQAGILTTLSSSIPETELEIYGDIVVWTESHNLFMYNTVSREKTQITDDGTAYEPAIYGNWIAYEYGSGDNRGIYIYDISTSRITRIPDSNRAHGPSVYGDNAIYIDSSSPETDPDVRDIYLYDLSNAPISDNITANFTSNVTSGIAPLTIAFTDASTGTPELWQWNFGDGATSNEKGPVHTYLSAGNYTVNLTVSNSDSSDSKLATIIVSENVTPVFIVANFSTTLTDENDPLTIQFTDLSQNATLWNWDFGDGATSTLQNPAHTYESPGNYVVSLTSSSENVTASRSATITVLESSSSGDSESGGRGSHSSSSGGSGGAGGSPEPAKNVAAREISQVFITKGNPVKFDFPMNVTAIVNISFDPEKTVGKTTTIVEMLRNKSSLTPGAPEDEVYSYLNIWVGNGGYGNDENNLKNASICFRVEKSWTENQNINRNSIILNRYSDKKWNELPTSWLGEDDKYLYFSAKTPGFASFAVTGKTEIGKTEITGAETRAAVDGTQNESTSGDLAIGVNQLPEQNQSPNISDKESTEMPGFEIVFGIICIISIFLFKRK